MKRFTWIMTLAVLALLTLPSLPARAADNPDQIDWAKAQQINQKAKAGQPLSDDEKAYLEQAKRLIAAGKGPGAQRPANLPADMDWAKVQELRRKEVAGQSLTDEEKAYFDRAKKAMGVRPDSGPTSRPGELTPKDSIGVRPLTEMTADDKYKGEDGGLYGGGSNTPPKELADAAAKAIAAIQPLDGDGKPDKNGKIVLASMGMSNTTQEFSRFKQLADADPDKSPQLVIVDCAQGGQAATQWNGMAGERVWAEAERRLKAAGVTPNQVQIVLIKQALIGQGRYGEFPAHAKEFKTQLVGNIQGAIKHFPNLKVAFLSSRIYGGYTRGQLNPEPYAYEGAYSVRWIIQDQIKGSKELNFDPAKGEVKAPVLLWGPYLWADGMTPRKADGLVYTREDLGPDGTHPSPVAGRQKVAEQMHKFFKTDPLAKGVFLKPSPAGGVPGPAGDGKTTVPPL